MALSHETSAVEKGKLIFFDFFLKKSDLSILREIDLLCQLWRLAAHEPLDIEGLRFRV
jgi:hypothetical protein